MDRRTFLLAAAATTALPTGALAINQASATSLINKVVDEINGVINSGARGERMFKQFERIFARYSDTSYISAYAMGVDARRATAAQKRNFSKAFQTYVARKYGKRFREFDGGKLEVTGVRQVKRWYEVTTTAFLPNEAPFEVTFQVSNRSGKDLFFNMFIEGINLLQVERDEIGSIIDKNGGNIDKMIAELRKSG